MELIIAIFPLLNECLLSRGSKGIMTTFELSNPNGHNTVSNIFRIVVVQIVGNAKNEYVFDFMSNTFQILDSP